MSVITQALAMSLVATAIAGVPAIHAKADTTAAPRAAQPAVDTPAKTTVDVKIDNFNFQPRELKISVGTKVTWLNADDVPHTATSKDDPQTFDSGAIDTDEKYSFTFLKPGKYTYFCKVHPHMIGVVIVK